MLDLGRGSGPMNHAFDITGRFVMEAGEEQANTADIADTTDTERGGGN